MGRLREPARPVRDGGEQKARDDGRQVAVEELMHMPVNRREAVGRSSDPASISSQTATASAGQIAPKRKKGRKP